MCRSVEKLVAQASDASLAKGHAEGRTEGRVENQVETIRKFMNKMSYSIDEAMDFLDIPESERETYRKLLAQ